MDASRARIASVLATALIAPVATSAAWGVVRRNARQSEARRYGWLPHAATLAVNAVGALIVAEGFDEDAGYVSGAIGFAVGGIRIWSHPWQATRTLEAYEERFSSRSALRWRWRLEPWQRGARVVVEF